MDTVDSAMMVNWDSPESSRSKWYRANPGGKDFLERQIEVA